MNNSHIYQPNSLPNEYSIRLANKVLSAAINRRLRKCFTYYSFEIYQLHEKNIVICLRLEGRIHKAFTSVLTDLACELLFCALRSNNMSAKLPLTFTLTSIIAEAFLSLRIKFLLGNLWIKKKIVMASETEV